MNKIAVAVAVGLENIWIPPNGRPYWTKQGANAGPHLTDEELDSKNLSQFKKYPFSETWKESCSK